MVVVPEDEEGFCHVETGRGVPETYVAVPAVGARVVSRTTTVGLMGVGGSVC